MTEQEDAKRIAERVIDFRVTPIIFYVHGEPDCDAVVLARQYIRALEEIDRLKRTAGERRSPRGSAALSAGLPDNERIAS